MIDVRRAVAAAAVFTLAGALLVISAARTAAGQADHRVPRSGPFVVR